MAEYATQHKPKQQAQANALPLFEEFDPETHGGLMYLPSGTIAELRHPYWAHSGDTDVNGRLRPLPFVQSSDEGVRWRPAVTWDPTRPTLGGEKELYIMTHGNGHAITENARDFLFPDGTTSPVGENTIGLQIEFFKYMLEWNTPVARGWQEHGNNIVERSAQVERWLEEHDLHSPALSVLPHKVTTDDLVEHSYTKVTYGLMRSMEEFACMSDQLHIQMKNPELGLHALTMYQSVQAVFNIITAAAPVRDDTFETTLGEHYLQAPKPHAFFANQPDGALLDATHAEIIPYDWRELARIYGSCSSGAYPTVPSMQLDSFLRLCDEQLREGEIFTTARSLGWHRDRLRLDEGAIEICNMGTSGGNLHKALAVQELVSKYIIAQQCWLEKLQHANPDWHLIANDFHAAAIQIAVPNNTQASIHGKQVILRVVDQTGTAPQIIDQAPHNALESIIAFTNTYCPVSLTQTSRKELSATLLPPEVPPYTFASSGHLFAYFFSKDSRLTATEVLRYAHNLWPQLPTGRLLQQFALARRKHTYVVHETLMKGTR